MLNPHCTLLGRTRCFCFYFRVLPHSRVFLTISYSIGMWIELFLKFLHHAVFHYSDVIMDAMASQITSLTIVSSTVCSGADRRKHQSSASLSFVRGIHLWPVSSPHKWPVTRKCFPFDDVKGPRWWYMYHVCSPEYFEILFAFLVTRNIFTYHIKIYDHCGSINIEPANLHRCFFQQTNVRFCIDPDISVQYTDPYITGMGVTMVPFVG